MNISHFVVWIFCFLLFDVWIHADGEREVFAPARRVRARPGDTAVLPCRLRPELDVTAFIVEWRKEDGGGGGDYIHIYRRGAQRSTGAMATSLFLDRLGTGDISLAVLNVTPADSGTYRCAVPRLDGGANMATLELLVDPDYVQRSTTAPPSSPPPPGGNTVTAPGAAGPGTESKPVPVAMAIVIVIVIVISILTILIIVLIVVLSRRQKHQRQDTLRTCWTSPTDPEPVNKVFLEPQSHARLLASV